MSHPVLVSSTSQSILLEDCRGTGTELHYSNSTNQGDTGSNRESRQICVISIVEQKRRRTEYTGEKWNGIR